MSKILVTGTAGFVGMHTALRLHADGHQVVGLDNINDYYDVGLKYGRLAEQGISKDQIVKDKLITGTKGISFIETSLANEEVILGLFKDQGFDYVINLAAQAGVRYSIENPRTYIKSNIDGFLNILEGCRRYPVKHLVFASSSSVYGKNRSIPFRESDRSDHPVSLYAATKKANEMMAHSYANLYDIPSTGLRFFTVYGPWGRPDMAYFIFTDKILKGETINVFNHGDMSRDYTYIDDIVEGITRIMTIPPAKSKQQDLILPTNASSDPYRIMNIGNGSPVNLNKFILTLEKTLEHKADINYMDMQPGDVETTFAATDNLSNITGYEPKVTVAEGLNRFVKWYRNYYKLAEQVAN